MCEHGFQLRSTTSWLCDLGQSLSLSKPGFTSSKVGVYRTSWLRRFSQALNQTRSITHQMAPLSLARFMETDSELSNPLGLIPGLGFLHQRRRLLDHLSWAQLPEQHSVATDATLLTVTAPCGNTNAAFGGLVRGLNANSWLLSRKPHER